MARGVTAELSRASRAGERQADGRERSPEERGHGGGGLERVTVNLMARASRALQQAVEITGYSKTDTINRALQVYAYLEEIDAKGGEVYIRESKDSELQLVKMFLSCLGRCWRIAPAWMAPRLMSARPSATRCCLSDGLPQSARS